jgi:hypothetical protein
MPRSCHEFGQGVSLANPAGPKTLKIFWPPLKKTKKGEKSLGGVEFHFESAQRHLFSTGKMPVPFFLFYFSLGGFRDGAVQRVIPVGDVGHGLRRFGDAVAGDLAAELEDAEQQSRELHPLRQRTRLARGAAATVQPRDKSGGQDAVHWGLGWQVRDGIQGCRCLSPISLRSRDDSSISGLGSGRFELSRDQRPWKPGFGRTSFGLRSGSRDF